MTIATMSKRWQSLDIAREAAWVLLENRTHISEYNLDQLRDGELSDSSRIKPKYRNTAYQQRKSRLYGYKLGGTPDLRYTGDFYRGWVIRLQGENKYSFDSIDGKRDDLVDKYTIRIFGLNNQSKTEVRERIMQPDLVKRIESKIFVK